MNIAHTSRSLIEQMAFNSGREIEIVGNKAFLVTGDIVWTAELPKAGEPT